jgi:hypothetical protein
MTDNTKAQQNTKVEDECAMTMLEMLIEEHCDIENSRIIRNWIDQREVVYLASRNLGLIE